MPLNLLFLLAILVILVANMAVVAAAAHRDGRPWLPAWSRRWLDARSATGSPDAKPRRSPDDDRAASPPTTAVPGAVDDRARTAAAIEAFVAGLDPGTGGSGRAIGPAAAAEPDPSARVGPDNRAEAGAGAPSPGSATDVDEPADPATWERVLAEEAARFARFGRPASIVFAECPDLDRVAQQLGAPAAGRVAGELARLVLAEGRTTDRIVRLGAARFAALLIETDERGALRYVERIRNESDGWLAAAGLVARLRVGLASPDRGGDLARAAQTAEERMVAGDSRSTANGRPPSSRPSARATTRT